MVCLHRLQFVLCILVCLLFLWCWWVVSCCCLFDCFGLFVGFVVSILCIYVLVISGGIYVFDIAFLTSVFAL